MFAVLVKRVYKVGTGAKGQYEARSANHTEWAMLGPFAKRRTAERAALNASRGHTCLSALVVSAETVDAVTNGQECHVALDKLVKLVKSLAVEVA